MFNAIKLCYVMLCSHATVSITISGDVYRWVKTTESQIPPNALVAGHDNYSKENVYIGKHISLF